MKPFQSIITPLTAMTCLLVFGLLSTFAIFEIDAYRREEHSRSALTAVNGVSTIMSAMVAVRDELAVSNLALEEPEAAPRPVLKQLLRLHRTSEEALNRVRRELADRPKTDADSSLGVLIAADNRYRAMFARVERAAPKPRKNRTRLFSKIGEV